MAADIRYLILAVTSRCNLRCGYCYLAAGEDGLDMTDAVLDQALDLAGNSSQPCHIQITGGEPTLVPDKIARIAERSRLMRARPHLAIQTNATLLTRDMVQLFKEYEFQIGVSLDGPPEIQDVQRGMASETLRGLKLLESEHVPFRVTTVVTKDNVLSLDKLALLLAGFTNSRGIGLDLLVSKGRAATGFSRPPSSEELRRGVSGLASTLALINKRRSTPLRLRELDLLCGSGGDRPFCRAATGQSLAVRPDGRLYPCGQTMGDPHFFMGTVEQPEFTGQQPLTGFRLDSGDCHYCPLVNNCPGDCPSRIHYNNEEGKKLTCTMYTTLDAFRGSEKNSSKLKANDMI